MKTTPITGLAFMLILILPTTSIVHAAIEPSSPTGKFQISGAGATFPFPIIDKWRVEYSAQFPDVTLNYQSIGSGGGVKQHTEKTVDFGASDAPLSKAEAEKASGTLHIPETIGAITISYNVPEIPQKGLKLTGTIIADIYLGKITKWNDKKIQDLNEELKLPNKDILVVRRSDGSGTTYGFTDYLSTVSKTWNDNIGKGKSVPWPVGVGSPGNEGVAGVIQKTPYSIGYIELAYALQSNMSYAFIQNADGTSFVEPSLESIKSAASEASKKLPTSDGDWSKVSIVNQSGKNSYPISSFSYLLVYKDLDKLNMDKQKAKALVHLIYWMITDGQQYAPSLQYVPLPDEVKEIGKIGLSQINFEGEQLFPYAGTGNIGNITTEQKQTSMIPNWVKNNAKWWSDGQIGDSDFVKGIQYLIQEKIMIIPPTKSDSTTSQQIPSWVKNNAKWWSDGQIGDSDFVKGIQYLIANGIMTV